MKKYFVTAGYVFLYLAILIAVFIPGRYLIYGYWPARSKAFDKFISTYPLLMIFTVFVITIAAYYILFRIRKTDLFKVCSFSPVSLKNLILLIALGLFMLVTILGLSSFSFVLNKYPSLETYINGTMRTGGFLAALVVLTCAVVLCEEIIFRGVIFGEMKANIHLIPAALIHAAIYALIIGEPVVGVISFITCLIYAFIYTVTGSLWSTVTVQLSNALGLMLLVNTGFKDYVNKSGDGIKYIILLAGVAGITAMCWAIRSVRKNQAPVNPAA